jgi:hypothetical protein
MPTCSADQMTGRRLRPRSSGGGCSADSPGLRRSAAASIRICRRRVIEPLRNLAWGQFVFAGLWLFIATVSAFDTYLTVRFHESLHTLELNPFARTLLQMAGWEPSLLVGLKFLGSVLVLGFLMLVNLYNRRFGMSITAGVASFQLWLLGFLLS